jgi:hypothetical protein
MALKLYSGQTGDIKVYASDYKIFIRELNRLDPEHSKRLKKRFKEIAQPAKQGVASELKQLGSRGPMRGMRHGGRTGWGTNYGSTGGPVSGAKRVPYNSVFVRAFNRPKRGATGIAQIQVRSAATVIGDLAQKASGRAYTRPYRIREFGGPEIVRTHQIRSSGVNQMISNLGPISKPSKRGKSRYVYPGFDKSYPLVKPEAEVAIKEAIRLIESNLDRTGR